MPILASVAHFNQRAHCEFGRVGMSVLSDRFVGQRFEHAAYEVSYSLEVVFSRSMRVNYLCGSRFV